MKSPSFAKHVLQATAILVASSGVSYANLVLNPGFENPGVGGDFIRYTPSTPEVPSGFAWTVSQGVDLVRSTFWLPQEGSQSLDLNAYATLPGSVSQTILTSAGTLYRVSFWIAANPDHVDPEQEGPNLKTMDVTFGSVTHSYSFDVTGHTATSMGWLYQEFLASASDSSTLLSFLSTSDGYAGMTLDNVSVEAVVVPEPSTYIAGALLFLPFGAHLIRRLRTRF